MIINILQIKKEEMDEKHDPSNLFPEGFKYNILQEKDEEKVNRSEKKLFLKE